MVRGVFQVLHRVDPPSGYVKIAIENGHLWWVPPLKMVLFHSYVTVYQRVTTTGNQGVEPCASAGTSPLSLPIPPSSTCLGTVHRDWNRSGRGILPCRAAKVCIKILPGFCICVSHSSQGFPALMVSWVRIYHGSSWDLVLHLSLMPKAYLPTDMIRPVLQIHPSLYLVTVPE